MLERWETLTKKYAQAFLNLYGSSLDNKSLEALTRFESFLQGKKQIYAYLCLSAIASEKKIELLNNISHQFKLPSTIDNLVSTLLEHRRIELLGAIVKKIIKGYKAQQNIVFFTVATSHEIDKYEQAKIYSFIQGIINKKITVEFCVEPRLISGMRIQSDFFIWERSIAKQLKIVKFDTLQRVRL